MPDDPTPLGDAMTHRFNDQKIPEPKQGRRERKSDELDISDRPPLPDHRRPGAADGRQPPSRQRGLPG